MYKAVKPAYRIVVHPTKIPIIEPLFEGVLLVLEETNSAVPSIFVSKNKNKNKHLLLLLLEKTSKI
jgi:hypothetical protein